MPSTTPTREMALRTSWLEQHWSYYCRNNKWQCYLSRTMSNFSEGKRDYPAWTFKKFWFRHKEPYCKNFWRHQRWLQEWMWRQKLDSSWHLPTSHAVNNSESYVRKQKISIWYWFNFTMCSRRTGMWNYFVRPLCLHLGLSWQLCDLNSSNWGI